MFRDCRRVNNEDEVHAHKPKIGITKCPLSYMVATYVICMYTVGIHGFGNVTNTYHAYCLCDNNICFDFDDIFQ